MTREELIEEWERRRAEAARHGARAPLAKVYSIVLEELRRLDGTPEPGRRVTTAEAAEMLGVSVKTVRRWIDDGRLPGDEKTSENGEWRIPAAEVHRAAGRDPGPPSDVPRLWEPEDDR